MVWLRRCFRHRGEFHLLKILASSFADLLADGWDMRTLHKLRAVAGAIPRFSVRRQAARFLRATRDCRATQHRVLSELLALNGDSRFSREHKLLRVRGVDDFRRHLPIVDFEYFRSYIDEVKQGEHSALLGSHNKLLMFTLSSGTTSESKFIPITQRFLDDYRRGWQIWGIHALDAHPRINALKIVQLSSDFDRFRTPGGTPCGNISGLVAAIQKRIVRTMYSVPSLISKIPEYRAKYYATLRLAVADANVGMVTTANPSTLLQLARMADEVRDELIRDIADGTISPDYEIPKQLRQKMRRLRLCHRNPSRARMLERIIEQTGQLTPRDFWPRNQLLAVWTGGSAGAYLRKLSSYYGDVAVRDHGLSASEGRMTIPLSDGCSDGVLDVTTHYFEFIPETEYSSESPTVLEAHELEEGQSYYILLTTSSGLYRYDIRDVVRCTGFCGTTPMLEFLHKGAHISNITGEKLSESQVATAVSSAAASLQLDLEHFTVTPVWGEPPEYQLLVEHRDVRSPLQRASLAANVDDSLQTMNCEYREKRGTGRLAPMSCIPLSNGAWQQFMCRRVSGLGGSIEQYKHPCLVPDLNFKNHFMREFLLESNADVSGPHATRLGRQLLPD